MRNRIGAAALAITLLTGIGIAKADVDPGQVTVAYVDGYMTTDGQFHAWERRSDAENFRAKDVDKYRPWRRDDPRHKGDH